MPHESFREVPLMTNEKATEGADEVRALEFSLESAVVLADLETLERLHAEDFTFIHSTGRIDTKESWLGRIRSGESSFRRRTLSDLDVEMHDDVAVTSGRIEVETGSGHGPR